MRKQNLLPLKTIVVSDTVASIQVSDPFFFRLNEASVFGLNNDYLVPVPFDFLSPVLHTQKVAKAGFYNTKQPSNLST